MLLPEEKIRAAKDAVAQARGIRAWGAQSRGSSTT